MCNDTPESDGIDGRQQSVWSNAGLPTELEWRYACRAGSSGSYGYGEPVPLLERYAQYTVNSSGRSQLVESLLPNAMGLFDMHGNLREWVQDPLSGPMSPLRNSSYRVLRGGSFAYPSSTVRSANRNFNPPAGRNNSWGFRVARTLPPAPVASPSRTP